MKRFALIAALGMTAGISPAAAQVAAPAPGPQQGAQGQVIHYCPPGYTCTPSPQPPAMQPRPMTLEEQERLRALMVEKKAGTILSPAEINAIRDRGLDAQGAATNNGYSSDDPPEPAPRVITITDPTMRVPDRIYLALGVVTPVTFLDKAGKPWPVLSVAYDQKTFRLDGVGCDTAAQAAPPSDARPTTLAMMPCRYKTFGNILVTLDGMSAPIVLFAISGDGSRKIDLPVTVKVTGPSPASAAKQRDAAIDRKAQEMRRSYTAGAATPKGVDPELDAFLAAVPPKGAEVLRTDMPGLSAWIYGDRIYIRGPVSVLNPSYDAMGSGTNGQFVYRFNGQVSRIRVVLDDGAERAVTLGL